METGQLSKGILYWAMMRGPTLTREDEADAIAHRWQVPSLIPCDAAPPADRAGKSLGHYENRRTHQSTRYLGH